MIYRISLLLSLTFICLFISSEVSAQVGGGFGATRAVGGVMVDANGVIRSATISEKSELLAAMRQSIKQAQGDLAQATDLRLVSLAKLQAALAESERTGEVVSEELRFLAGLKRIEYVFVYPEENDIVIGGPAEAWTVRDDATVVGSKSGSPVLQLDDLVTAFRSVEGARKESLTCSIDPTPQGSQRLQNLLKNMTLRPGQDPRGLEPAMREAFGPQIIKLTGVAKDSHYARTMVAADYQMKRIGMALEPSPIKALPSYLAMASGQRHSGSANPRWWMACNYDALSRTEDKLAWKISGQGVKTLTETAALGKDGEVVPANQIDRMAQKWAETMTAEFENLAIAQPIFGELRNCIDLSVVATLIVQENLAQRAGCDLTHLLGQVETAKYQVPQAVEPQCSFVRGRAGWTVTASGGVDVNAFEVVSKQVVSPEIAALRERKTPTPTTRWWWNG